MEADGGLQALPSSSLTDIVSYADSVAVVTVTKVTRLEPTAAEQASGDGLVVRLVTLAVKDALWSAEGAHALPERIVVPAGGWIQGEGKDVRRLVIEGAADFEIGHDYVLPVFYDDSFDPAWQGLAQAEVVPFDDGIAGRGENVSGGALLAAVRGQSADGIRAVLAAARPDPVAKRYSALQPVARYQAVLRATPHESATGYPGEH